MTTYLPDNEAIVIMNISDPVLCQSLCFDDYTSELDNSSCVYWSLEETHCLLMESFVEKKFIEGAISGSYICGISHLTLKNKYVYPD